MKFWYDIGISTIANILSVVVIAVLGYLVLVIRHSILYNFSKKYIHPQKRVLSSNITALNNIKKIETHFNSCINQETKEVLLDLYSNRTSTVLYDNPAIRIDNAKGNGDLEISLITFYDFITTNLIAYPANSPTFSLQNMIHTITKHFSLFNISNEVRNKLLLKIGKQPNFQKVLSVNELANIATVSILIEDTNGDIALVKRTNRVAISSGHFSVSAAGTPTNTDYNTENPFLECAKREIKEELGIEDISLEFKELIISKQKMQPVFLYNGKLNDTWNNYYKKIILANDFSFETENLYIVPFNSIMYFIKRTIMTDASSYQLWKYVYEKSKKDMWYIPHILPCNIRKFCTIKKGKVI